MALQYSPTLWCPTTIRKMIKSYRCATFIHNPTDREIICSQLIGRSIRPLFTAGVSANITVFACVLKSKSKHDAELLAIIATSAALMTLNITRAGPVGAIRIGRINERIIINPTPDEQRTSDINLVYVCTREKTIMVDLEAREISESDLAINLKLAHLEVVKCIDSQVKLRKRYGKDKNIKLLTNISKNLQDTRSQSSNYGEPELALGRVTTNGWRGKLEKNTSMTSTEFIAECNIVKKKADCAVIISDGHRFDGRSLDQIRPVQCEAGYLKGWHGSSLLSCGETQVLCTATIGELVEAQSADSLVVLPRKIFSVDYDVPSFCTNRIVETSSPARREIGHGMFVEKALLAVIPSERDFPYNIHLNSTVLSSDGSSMTTSVCGGSIALMDAGVPLQSHVAGVSIGLVIDDETSSKQLEKYRIIVDILVSKVSNVLSIGKQITLKCIRKSSEGIIEFSLKAVA